MEKKCDCICCQMTCPQCGEWDGIRVDMDIDLNIRIDNDTYGFISFDKYVECDDIQVECESCGYIFSEEESEALKCEIYRYAQVELSVGIECVTEEAA